MNTIRQTIGELFQSPVSNMNFVSYFNYVNASGKVTARSLMDLDAVIFTFLEEQEKINLQNEENFKQIFEILAKLVKAEAPERVEESVTPAAVGVLPDSTPITLAAAAVEDVTKEFTCDLCPKTFKAKIGLFQHSKLHKV